MKQWKTGVFVKASSAPDYFSFDNYGDITTKKAQITGNTKKLVSVFNPRAMKFMTTANSLKNEHWDQIFDAAKEFLAHSGKGRRGASSSSSVKVEPDVGDNDEGAEASSVADDFNFLSDVSAEEPEE